ncbi:ribosome maturation factor RimP [Metabacillus idriensis]|uniref:Ribosome maturation factor RimP n=1 Tax=Metabacillus idriensis TaxID=324768 RepID=A0A6I2M9U5_9BACI|nr:MULTISPECIES: ribosome maturation factor RimP [Bacillaceae]OHR64897.1 ribosome maturation factor RimP [Bacillus sp. HMSC76G11]MCM3594263.1 ribosome maturation factor RimP [Metabacillus idriensis]MDR0137402.1 ribosome maturation factor RimP [Metabacillus idriensis]MRX53706.1 ribosome maturation factor RimP [Metabacillus idriensis]TDL83299.1 ribosome maturation factor RimP [Peribacillus frigoritolerans]
MSKKVTEIVAELAMPILDELTLELVDVEFVKEGKEWFLRVFIDSSDGIDIEHCAIVSEKLSEKLDETDPIEQNYFLEVSSPGAERPLKKDSDFTKSIGKNVYIKTYEPFEGSKVFEGELTAFDGEHVIVTILIKTRKKQIQIPYEKIASARLAVTFN